MAEFTVVKQDEAGSPAKAQAVRQPPVALIGHEEVASELALALNQALVTARRGPTASKDAIREAHAGQRRLRALSERKWLEAVGRRTLSRFAESTELEPSKFRPIIVPIPPGDGADARLFRAASLLWSVPVSRGYGRRMRFLVLDASNQKLIGVFALGDPVFNLRVRDRWIGWSTEAREARISSVMDLFVCGAVPPYSQLLAGKLVASLATSQEVVDGFRRRYVGVAGIISKEVRPMDLLLLTTTSALGRSSMYNRIHLNTQPPTRLQRIGDTDGWGHFAVSDALFRRVRAFLAACDHRYADGHGYGTGPNWRLRTIRAAIDLLGLDPQLLRHGIQREVFACEMVENAREQLACGVLPGTVERPTASTIADLALERWVRPRFARQRLQPWTREDLWKQLLSESE